jgi:tryptophan-rich sensory protein
MFAANGVLNIAWSALFFHFHRPDLALAEVFALWLSIAALIVAIRPFSSAGSWFLAPYLAWVSFAAILNFAVVRLNYPFVRS